MRDDFELRCFCRTKPLLAKCGRDERGEPYVHVKAWKGQRLYAEVIADAGTVKLRCRECLRWHSVKIVRGGAPVLQESPSGNF